MRDITHKQISLRTASAVGVLFCSAETISLIREDKLPKGNLFDVARAAGFAGAKLTPQLLPHCHPVAIDGMGLEFEFLDGEKHAELLTGEGAETFGYCYPWGSEVDRAYGDRDGGVDRYIGGGAGNL